MLQGRLVLPLLLASTSPRRRALLAAAGIAFELVTPGAEVIGNGTPRERCVQRARGKALGAKLPGATALVLGVDTVVELDGEELDKPRDEDHARATLAALAGREHLVHTAHCLHRAPRGPAHERLVSARVRCARLDERAIAAFLASGEWRDKAGGYGIQGHAARFMSLVEGELDTVVGLSVRAVRELLAEAGARP